MDLKEEIKKLQKRGLDNPPPMAKMVAIFAATLSQAASQHAFKLFRDKNFRRLSDFDNLEKIEQDRIFNELVLADLVLLMLTLEAPDLRIPQEMKEYFLQVKDELLKAHIKYLESLGIENKYLNDWKKLIGMRYEEYSLDKHEARQAAMEIESKESELTTEKISDIQLLLPVHTVAIGCHYHICRQKVEGKDELFKIILHSLGQFYVEMRVPIEGGKITPLGRIRAGLRHLWQRISKR